MFSQEFTFCDGGSGGGSGPGGIVGGGNLDGVVGGGGGSGSGTGNSPGNGSGSSGFEGYDPNNPVWVNPNNPGNGTSDPNPNNPVENELTDANTLVTSPVSGLIRSFVINILNSEQEEWWNNRVNQTIVNQIILYLQQNTINNVINPQAQVFSIYTINALIEGGQVDFNYKVIIDPSFENNTTLMNVYNQFGGLPTFQSYLQNFEGSFSVAHLKLMASSTLPSSTNAQTSAPQNYVITITFNTNNLDRPDLSIARTMMHEMIHAEIFRKMLSSAGLPHVNFNNYTQQQWVNYITNLQNDFPGIYDYYIRWAVQNQSPSAQQHEMMAQHYRDIIVQSLIEFDDSHPNELYQALAWVGLKDTVAWNNLSQTEKNNINLIILNFEN